MFEIVSANVSPWLWADFRWDVVTPAPAPGRRLPAPGILDTDSGGHIVYWGAQNDDTFNGVFLHRVYELMLIMYWTLSIWAEYSPLWPGSVGVTQREFWLCLFDPALIYDQLSILSHNLLWTCPIMSSQRVFDAGDMYWRLVRTSLLMMRQKMISFVWSLAPWRWSMQASADFYVSWNADDCVFLSWPGSLHSQIISI